MEASYCPADESRLRSQWSSLQSLMESLSASLWEQHFYMSYRRRAAVSAFKGSWSVDVREFYKVHICYSPASFRTTI